MASSEGCSLFLGHGPLIIKRNMAGIPAVAVGSRCRSRSRAGASSLAISAFPHCPRFLLPVSCKRKDRNPSSRTKRQDAKRVSPDRSPLSENILLNGEEITEVQNATADGFSSSQLGTAPSSVAGTSASMHRDAENVGISSSLGDRNFVIEEVNGEEQLPSSHLEDLTGMIKNTEKNILLLNEARVNALKDLDKILLEKEGLQAEINKLEMKLAEMDTQSKVAAPEEIHPEFLEDHFEKQNNEISSSERMMGNKNNSYERVEIFNSKDSSFDAVDLPSLSEELSALREENASLKGDIRIFMSKISDVRETDECVLQLEEERSMLKSAVRELKSKLATAQEDVSKAATLDLECKDLLGKVENLQMLLDDATRRADQALTLSHKNEELERKVDKLESKLVTAQEDALKLATLDLEYKDLLGKVDNLQMLLDDATKTAVQAVPLSHKNVELERKVDKLESSLEEANAYKFSLEQAKKYNETLQQKIEVLEVHLQASDQEINSHIELYQASVQEFQDTLDSLKEESKRRSLEEAADNLPWEFWSRLLLILDGWLLEKKISIDDANLLREMAWKRDGRIRDAYIACRDKSEHETVDIFLQLTSSQRSSGIHIVHIAAEMAPVAKVGGLGDVVTGLSKSLQKRGHLVEIILPMYDCMHHDLVTDLKELDVALDSYFDGQHFKNKIWVGLVEGLPVYFIEPHHPWKFFWRGQYYGEHDDFKRFSFFSRAALEFLFQSGKKPDIIHCHDWQTAFIPPLYWDVYATKGFNSARICFTCHNFEYQGIASASELTSCGLDVQNLNRPDRLQDNSSHDRINPVKGAIVFSNIVTTVSPSYAQEVRTAEGGRGLHETLNFHSRKFVGILNGIDTDAWNPETDTFLRNQYSVDDLRGKVENKVAIRKHLKLSLANTFQPLVGCITRLVPQKGVHLIRHAIYRTLELGGQFVLLGSSPVPHIQREFEEIANHFENHPHIRLILKYNDALSHNIYAASDMFVIPSMFEPCGLTQMIAMRYGSVPIVRRTGGLNDSVFDVDDDTIPVHLRNGFTFLSPDEQGLSSAMERAFELYVRKPDIWQQLVQKDMRIDFSWDSSSAQYEELYTKAIARARAANQA